MQYLDSEIIAEINDLGPWFHNIHIREGLQTAPHHELGDFPNRKWLQFKHLIPSNLDGWRVLDIGCNAGFYSFELAKRGANVLAIDADATYLKQAKWIANHFYKNKNQPNFQQLQIHQLAHLSEYFDLVLFLGVFYHLRYPILALDTVSQLTDGIMIFQTLTMDGDQVEVPKDDYALDDRIVFDKLGWPKMAFIENKFANDPTNWWVPNHSAVEALLRSSGFEKIHRVAHEIYFCEVKALDHKIDKKIFKEEWMSATGVYNKGKCL